MAGADFEALHRKALTREEEVIWPRCYSSLLFAKALAKILNLKQELQAKERVIDRMEVDRVNNENALAEKVWV